MPELPEVENVRLSLVSLGSIGQTFADVELLREGLRTPFPSNLKRQLVGRKILSLERRAKYLLFETEKLILLSHLGMTGSWRIHDANDVRKHDHVILHFTSGLKLVFNDPRRFGVLDVVAKSRASKNRWLEHLGVEPLGNLFDKHYLFKITRGKKISLKALIMDQRHVVGVGNIYASEALFAARVKPSRSSGRLTLAEADRLVGEIRRILSAAIAAGGSTIRDYRNSHGESGQFQSQFLVYDRKDEPCLVCATPIRSKLVGGRTTYWCVKCQR